MNSFLQPSIKNYLIEALQTNLTSNPANEYYNTLKDYYVISEAEDGSTRANAEVDKKDNQVDPSKVAPVNISAPDTEYDTPDGDKIYIRVDPIESLDILIDCKYCPVLPLEQLDAVGPLFPVGPIGPSFPVGPVLPIRPTFTIFVM